MLFQTAIFTRKLCLKILDKLSLEELNSIPQGFNNNIFWNIAHIVVTEQMLSYGLSGLEIDMDFEFINRFKKDSICRTNYSDKDIKILKNEYFRLINKTQTDYKNNVFINFTEYLTSTNIILKNIKDALQFNTLHEGIHLGIILSIKKQLK